MSTMTDYLSDLVRRTQKSESEVMAMAIEKGLRQLWCEEVVGGYLRGELTRQDAVEAVGTDLVELAERQSQAVREDLAWAKSHR